MLVRDVCKAARSHLAALGLMGETLLDLNALVAKVAGTRGAEVLSEASFGVDVLTAAPRKTDAESLGVLLNLLRSVADTATLMAEADDTATIRELLPAFRADPLFTKKAVRTQRGYDRWYRLLDERYGDAFPASLKTTQLATMLETEVTSSPKFDPDDPNSGKSHFINGMTALRLFWRWLDDNDYAKRRVTANLVRPDYDPDGGAAWTWMEQACARYVALVRCRDPLAATLVLWLQEYVFMRGEEARRVRNCDFRLGRTPGEDMVHFWGKGGRWRWEPVIEPVGLLVRWFMEDRRPAHIDPEDWAKMPVPLVRSRPSVKDPEGKAFGEKGYDSLRSVLNRCLPLIFDGHVTLHGIGRKTGAAFISDHYNESIAQVALGHRVLRGQGGSAMPTSTLKYTGSNARNNNYARVREALTAFYEWSNTPLTGACGPDGWPLEAKVPPIALPAVVVDGVLDQDALVPSLKPLPMVLRRAA